MNMKSACELILTVLLCPIKLFCDKEYSYILCMWFGTFRLVFYAGLYSSQLPVADGGFVCVYLDQTLVAIIAEWF